MMTINSLLFGILAGLISFKIVLLAAATMLFVYGLTERARQRATIPATVPVRHRKLDVHA